MKETWVLFLLGIILISCSGAEASVDRAINPSVTSEMILEDVDAQPSNTPLQPETITLTLVPSKTPTLTSSPTHTPALTKTTPPTMTPTWIFNDPGQVVAPVLLYHHVEGDVSNNRYSVSVPDFRSQMQALHDWGYTAIPISLFLEALTNGAQLPSKPIVITFDDGNRNIYENAFPIMQAYNFPGVFYIVSNRVNSGTNIAHVPELKEMIDAGWEIGSHSYSHSDLTLDHSIARYEILQSKLDIEEALRIEVQTFAYPFGAIDPYLAQKVQDYGYRAGMGLGPSWTHTWGSIYYINRIEIRGNYSVDYIRTLLPWQGD